MPLVNGAFASVAASPALKATQREAMLRSATLL